MSEATAHDSLTVEQLRAFYAVQDWFVPQVAGYPAPRDADPDDEVLTAVMSQLTPLMPRIRRVLRAVDADADMDSVLADIRTSEPADFEAIRLLALARYLSCAAVWSALGYTGRKARPIAIGETDEYLSGGLLDPPTARGKIYRPTPVDAPAEPSSRPVGDPPITQS